MRSLIITLIIAFCLGLGLGIAGTKLLVKESPSSEIQISKADIQPAASIILPEVVIHTYPGNLPQVSNQGVLGVTKEDLMPSKSIKLLETGYIDRNNTANPPPLLNQAILPHDNHYYKLEDSRIIARTVVKNMYYASPATSNGTSDKLHALQHSVYSGRAPGKTIQTSNIVISC